MRVGILLPDGVGVRNFVYTDLPKSDKYDVFFITPLDLKGFNEHNTIKLPEAKRLGLVSILQQGKSYLESFIYAKKYNDNNYLLYGNKSMPLSWKGSLRNRVSSFIKWFFKSFYANDNGWLKADRLVKFSARKTDFYGKCIELFKENRFDFVFNTTQRSIVSMITLYAAKSLGIKTGSFVYSWDNLPKGGGLVCDSDYLFVWSDYMKDEIRKYYPYFNLDNVFVTGTPQFISYFDESRKWTREKFCNRYNLDIDKRFICFSGDDVTTSPNDQEYLKDIAIAVRELNKKEKRQLHIIFRRCPVDVSNRYDMVLSEFEDIITPIDPLWSKDGKNWTTILPTNDDLTLLVNTVLHSDIVINVGSTMALDFAIYNKVGCYIKYNIDNSDWDINRCYKFIHFRTMEELDPVYWITSKDEIKDIIPKALDDKDKKISDAVRWIERVAKTPLQDANRRLWSEIGKFN